MAWKWKAKTAGLLDASFRVCARYETHRMSQIAVNTISLRGQRTFGWFRLYSRDINTLGAGADAVVVQRPLPRFKPVAELVKVELPRPRLGVEDVERRLDHLLGFTRREGVVGTRTKRSAFDVSGWEPVTLKHVAGTEFMNASALSQGRRVSPPNCDINNKHTFSHHPPVPKVIEVSVTPRI